MLSTVGNVFFELTSISRAKGVYVPTVYLSMRKASTGKMIGQMRFNLDKSYSENHVRMAFNMMNLEDINPINTEGRTTLEEIIVGGLIWQSMDNHFLFPDGVLPYMVIHDYIENSEKANLINMQNRNVLTQYGCNEVDTNVFLFNPANGNSKLSEFLKQKQQK